MSDQFLILLRNVCFGFISVYLWRTEQSAEFEFVADLELRVRGFTRASSYYRRQW